MIRQTAKQSNRKYSIAVAVFFAMVFACMITIAFGVRVDTVHPDELQTRPAVLYFQDHLLSPDVRTLEDSYFSGYGMTRLWELNPYYLLAGKVSLVSGDYASFRIFGLLLALGIMILCLLMYRKNRAFAFVFALTPQVWYIFSYATSDAFDFFLGVVCLYQLVKEDSLLNRLFEGKDTKPWSYLLLGLLFALVLMGKKNYYLTALWVFSVLLIKLVFKKKEERKGAFTRCLCLLGVTLAVFGARFLYDQSMYDFHKSEVVSEQMELRAEARYKESASPDSYAEGFHLNRQGVAFSEFVTKYGFFGLLSKSFAGLYGAYNVGTNDLYYIVYYLILLLIWILWGTSALKKGADPMGKAYFFTALALTLFSFLLVVYNAYFVDFQPQGRYLFPAIPVLIYGLCLQKDLTDRKMFRICAVLLALLSLASFALIAVPRLGNISV